MALDFEHFSWATFLFFILALIIVVIGGIAVITENLTFETYLNDLESFAKGLGLLAIGRGIWKSGIVGHATRR
jgi:hypothetical protein